MTLSNKMPSNVYASGFLTASDTIKLTASWTGPGRLDAEAFQSVGGAPLAYFNPDSPTIKLTDSSVFI